MLQLSVLANYWILPAAVPYLAIAGYDFWLHETDRQVPRVESMFHGMIAMGASSFLVTAALGWNLLATVALVILLLAAVIDEVRFHADLDIRERRLHFFGGLALAFCIGVWLWTI